ncbi:MAG: hypothetical protein GDA38_15850 [Hormoscilla sp. SP12CHS1]|nr:hypothetical protein [Hormoscilla sp. SP12CHS1]
MISLSRNYKARQIKAIAPPQSLGVGGDAAGQPLREREGVPVAKNQVE